jgi:hypothetical protein
MFSMGAIVLSAAPTLLSACAEPMEKSPKMPDIAARQMDALMVI